MKKYFNPEYMNIATMSNDVITLSHNNHEEVKDGNGNVLYVVDTYRNKETNEYSGIVSADISALGM